MFRRANTRINKGGEVEAGVVELADTYDSGSYAARLEGSNPSSGTIVKIINYYSR